MTSAEGCTGTIVNTGNTCTITNTAQAAQPTTPYGPSGRKCTTRPTSLVSGRAAGETALTVTFVLFPSLAACATGGRARSVP